ncbi:hypothetical protein B0H19DRAFT_1060038 [Mycena capillaripes]|nr:hypothetical protein B0H19DRAFT_1060038 [Mycena capillaripes]
MFALAGTCGAASGARCGAEWSSTARSSYIKCGLRTKHSGAYRGGSGRYSQSVLAADSKQVSMSPAPARINDAEEADSAKNLQVADLTNHVLPTKPAHKRRKRFHRADGADDSIPNPVTVEGYRRRHSGTFQLTRRLSTRPLVSRRSPPTQGMGTDRSAIITAIPTTSRPEWSSSQRSVARQVEAVCQ